MGMPFPMAAVELPLLAGAVALALLLVFLLRQARRHDTIAQEVRRLGRALKDGALDARVRLEDAGRSMDALRESVAPRLEAMEPDLADLSSRMEEFEDRLRDAGPALAEAARRDEEAQESIAEATTRLEQAETLVRESGDRLTALDETARDIRNRVANIEESVENVRRILQDHLAADHPSAEALRKDLEHAVAALPTPASPAPDVHVAEARPPTESQDVPEARSANVWLILLVGLAAGAALFHLVTG